MNNKLICPFCQQELHKDPDGYYSCYTDNCSVMNAGGNGASGTESLWAALIQSQQDLEESQQATLENAQTVLEIHKDLEIATKALDWIGNNRLAENPIRVEQLRRHARNALEQINTFSME